jgi:hypothetical protein
MLATNLACTMERLAGLSDSWYGWTMFNAVTNKIKQFFMYLNVARLCG